MAQTQRLDDYEELGFFEPSLVAVEFGDDVSDCYIEAGWVEGMDGEVLWRVAVYNHASAGGPQYYRCPHCSDGFRGNPRIYWFDEGGKMVDSGLGGVAGVLQEAVKRFSPQ